MKKINVNGISLAYDRRGKGTPLVLIHGFPFDHTTWDGAAALLENAFDIIMPDLRGFGQSTAAGETYTIDDMAADIAGLLDQLGLEKAGIAGHSMGGYVALAFARLYPTHVRGLGLVSSQAPADTPDRRQGRYDMASRVAEGGVGVAADALAPKLTADLQIQEMVRQVIMRQPPAGIIGALKAMAGREDSASLLPLLKYAVVIVHGDADALIPVERGREMKAAIPHAQFVELPGVGHMPMLEDVQRTIEALKLLR